MRIALFMLLGFLGISALGGAWAMVGAPDGSAMGASTGLLKGTPFPDFFWPGVILGAVFGIGSFMTILLLAMHRRHALRIAQVIGVGQMTWIAVQVAMIREFHWLQPLFLSVGLMMFLFAERLRSIRNATEATPKPTPYKSRPPHSPH